VDLVIVIAFHKCLSRSHEQRRHTMRKSLIDGFQREIGWMRAVFEVDNVSHVVSLILIK
jgi:hypothetical protein